MRDPGGRRRLRRLLLWHKLREAGFGDVRFCEKGGDVGGTWYWNRYPGIACDVESYSYLPLLEEMGYVPTMKFASGFEILEYCQKMAEQFGFYDHCLFHTTVERHGVGRSDRALDRDTDRGDAMRARFVILANGILTTPKLARIEGMETFKGESRSTRPAGTTTSIWPASASASSAPAPPRCRPSPNWRRSPRHSTCSSARLRRSTSATSAPPRAEEVETWANEPGWARARRARFAKISPGRTAHPGERRLPRRQGARLQGAASEHERRLTPEELVAAATRHQLPDHGADPRARRRDRQRSEDRGRAQALLPVRLQAADVPRRVPADVQPAERHLVDAAPIGVREINEHGVVHDGVAIRPRRADLCHRLPVDGDVDLQHDQRSRRRDVDREVGRRRARARSSGCTATASRTCSSSPARKAAAAASTSPTPSKRTATTWCGCCRTMRDAAVTASSTSARTSEDAYAEHCRQTDIATAPLRDCLTYYNGDGHAEPGSLAYYGGNRWHKYRVEPRRRWRLTCSIRSSADVVSRARHYVFRRVHGRRKSVA